MVQGKLMNTYKNKPFCKETECKDWNECPRALTEKVKQEAGRLPIQVFVETPSCFKQIDL